MKATLEVINRMQAEGTIGKYAIGGAVGATFYMEPSATLDIDIFVSLENPPASPLLTLAPIYDYLTSRGYKAEKEYLVIEGWPVQFLPPADALDEEALEQAVETEVEGVRTLGDQPPSIWWPWPFEPLAPKISSASCNSLKPEFWTSGKLDAILKRHGLMEKWEQFGIKFLRGPDPSGRDNP